MRFRGVSVPSSLRFQRARQRRATAGHGRPRGGVSIRLRPSAGHHGAPNQEHKATQIAHTEAVDVRLLDALNKNNETVPVGYYARLHAYMVRHPRKLTDLRRLQRRPLATAKQQPWQRPLKLKQLAGRHQPRDRQNQATRRRDWTRHGTPRDPQKHGAPKRCGALVRRQTFEARERDEGHAPQQFQDEVPKQLQRGARDM